MKQTIQEFISARLDEANKRFAKMTKAQRAVAVAGDAIWQVTSGSVIPEESQGYFNIGWVRKSACTVCGIGGLFAGLMDHHKVPTKNTTREGGSTSLTRNECLSALQLSYQQSQAIEGAFEGWIDDREGLVFYDRYPEDHNRFLRICANIIHHHGEFIPTKNPSDARFKAIVKKYGAKSAKKKASAAAA